MGDIKLNSQITVQVPAEKLFAIWTDTKQMGRWFEPADGIALVEIDWDLRVGGRYRFGFRAPSGSIDHLHGEFREVSAPTRLCYTWVWERLTKQEEHDTLIEVDFLESGGWTEVAVCHSGFLVDVERDMHKPAWDNILAVFKRTLSELTA